MKTVQRYEVLDGLRGVCALLVCILHARILSHFYALDFIRNAYLFVDFFFVLSGFVICASYNQKLKVKQDLFKFTVKRIGRIWPLHILMLLAMLMIELSKFLILSQSSVESGSEAFIGRFSIESLFSNIFLLHSIGLHDSLTWNNPSWSISVEFFTYIFFALAIYFFRNNLKHIAILVVLLSFSILCFINPENMDVTYDYGIFRCLFGFFVGVFIFLWRENNLNLKLFTSSVIEFLLIFTVCLYVTLCGNNQLSLLSPFIFGIAVWFFSYELGLFSKLLKHKYIQFLGVLSFTMYMIHSVILTVIWRIGYLLSKGEVNYVVPSPLIHGYKTVLDVGGHFAGDIFLVIYLIFVIASSALIYRIFEEPLRLKFNQFANRKF